MTGAEIGTSPPAAAGWLAKSVIPAERKLAGIHGLRAVAALMVVFFHTCWIPQLKMPDWLWVVGNRFGLGVHLFFLLSAFSLAHSARVTGESLGTYWLKRFFRIAPLFYVMLIVYQAWFGAEPLGENVMSLLFAFNLVPSMSSGIVWASWTIGVEMIFYALLPLLLAMAPGRVPALALAVAGCAISVFGRIALEGASGLPPAFVHQAFVVNFGIFCLGLLAYRVYAGSSNLPRDRLIAALTFGALAILLAGPLLKQVFPGRADLVLWSFAFGVATVWQAARPSYLMRNAFMQFVGERSYSVYLLHPLAIFSLKGVYAEIYAAVERPGISFLLCAFLTVAIVLVLADITYRLVEVPGIELGRRVIRARKARQHRGADAGLS
jgi:peptidoglycan/LPS O-acetylase OafA/YrhL